MQVDENTADWSAEHEGKTYYFCSPGCLNAFREQPEEYLTDDPGGTGHEHHHG
jgi:YHS domain-containing protein